MYLLTQMDYKIKNASNTYRNQFRKNMGHLRKITKNFSYYLKFLNVVLHYGKEKIIVHCQLSIVNYLSCVGTINMNQQKLPYLVVRQFFYKYQTASAGASSATSGAHRWHAALCSPPSSTIAGISVEQRSVA